MGANGRNALAVWSLHQRCQGHLTSLNLKLVSLNQKLWEWRMGGGSGNPGVTSAPGERAGSGLRTAAPPEGAAPSGGARRGPGLADLSCKEACDLESSKRGDF